MNSDDSYYDSDQEEVCYTDDWDDMEEDEHAAPGGLGESSEHHMPLQQTVYNVNIPQHLSDEYRTAMAAYMQQIGSFLDDVEVDEDEYDQEDERERQLLAVQELQERITHAQQAEPTLALISAYYSSTSMWKQEHIVGFWTTIAKLPASDADRLTVLEFLLRVSAFFKDTVKGLGGGLTAQTLVKFNAAVQHSYTCGLLSELTDTLPRNLGTVVGEFVVKPPGRTDWLCPLLVAIMFVAKHFSHECLQALISKRRARRSQAEQEMTLDVKEILYYIAGWAPSDILFSEILDKRVSRDNRRPEVIAVLDALQLTTPEEKQEVSDVSGRMQREDRGKLKWPCRELYYVVFELEVACGKYFDIATLHSESYNQLAADVFDIERGVHGTVMWECWLRMWEVKGLDSIMLEMDVDDDACSALQRDLYKWVVTKYLHMRQKELCKRVNETFAADTKASQFRTQVKHNAAAASGGAGDQLSWKGLIDMSGSDAFAALRKHVASVGHELGLKGATVDQLRLIATRGLRTTAGSAVAVPAKNKGRAVLTKAVADALLSSETQQEFIGFADWKDELKFKR